MKKIMFDIGCNQGRVCNSYVHKGWDVYAFEPNPTLISQLKNKFSNYSNFKLFEKAVSNFNGKDVFNIVNTTSPAGTLGGCSSLLDFIDDVGENWPDRKNEFVVTEKINVEIIRLDNFIRDNKIKTIDFFKCDTQGNDLSVLEGLGDSIHIIKYGQVEVGNTIDPLYKNSNYYIKDVIKFLESKNFKIQNIDKLDPTNNESNLYFKQ